MMLKERTKLAKKTSSAILAVNASRAIGRGWSATCARAHIMNIDGKACGSRA